MSKSFIPSFLRSAVSGSRPVSLSFNDVKDTNISSTSSFIYDSGRQPLKSTQQLHVDWSKFENHAFFMNAEAKTNIAFHQIINNYPFDGEKIEVEKFFEGLSGFDNWVFEQFPKFRGQLCFSQSYISIKDHAGALFPELSKTSTGESLLTPNDGKSMTVEMQIFLPTTSSVRQVVFQKLASASMGFSFYIEPTASTSEAEGRFTIVSGSSHMTTIIPLTKGIFEHVSLIFNRDSTPHSLRSYRAGEFVNESRNNVVIGDMPLLATDFIIGSGSAITIGSTTLTPVSTLSGTLDEFRLYHSARTETQMKEFSRKSVFATPELKLYYRFNEPPPPLVLDVASALNGIVLDSSGNSFHSTIVNFTGSLRENVASSSISRMIFEKDITAPILFTANSDVNALNTILLVSASLYDVVNPNMITKLVPKHYFEEGQALSGIQTLHGTIGSEAFVSPNIPGSGQLGSSQLMLSFLYIYARFFDEIKLFVDSFRNIKYVNYDTNETVPDNFLLDLVDQLGFNLPPMFNDSTVEQYVHAENIDQSIGNSDYSLKFIQNELLRRTLVNMPDVLRSKGTQHSIKSFLRSIGIDPDNSIRIKELGGPSTKNLSFSREQKREPGIMIRFNTGSLISSPFLSASRLEPGFPFIAGTFVNPEIYNPHGISNNESDGLLTSGSWTVESIVKWTPYDRNLMTSMTQSLGRLMVTGSNDSQGGLIANVVAISSSLEPKLVLYVRSGLSSSSPTLTLELPFDEQNHPFNGSRWNISFGCTRNDEIYSNVSSSYFLRAANQSNGEIDHYSSTSSFFLETLESTDVNVFRKKDSIFNVSGSFFVVGENQNLQVGIASGSTYRFLNDTTNVVEGARATAFTGLMSNLRFWSKGLSEDEWKEHVKNYKSRGVSDPLVNFNFVTSRSGSFEKLRLETFVKQFERSGDVNGNLILLDFSQNDNHMTGSGFPVGETALIGELFDYSYLSPVFDEATTNDKIRARSFQNQDLVDQTPWAGVAPIHEILKSEEPTDDVRFMIEFSLIDALNRDIVTMFSTFDAIDNAIGSPELLYSLDYPDLENLRNIYFNRIQEKLNFKPFFEFFRWFDMSIGTFIEQLVPRKTLFKGTNFTIESHMLERHKIQYQGTEQYLAATNRQNIGNSLILAQIEGSFSKY